MKRLPPKSSEIYSFTNFIIIVWSVCARSVSPHLRILRCVGICRLSASAAPRRRAMHRVYHSFTLFVTCTYVLQQSMYAFQERNSLDKVTQVMFVMLCYGTCMVKQIIFYLKAEKIDDLIARLNDPLMSHASAGSGALLRRTARSAARLLHVYASCAVCTVVLWSAFPLLYWLKGLDVEFRFWTGFSYDTPLRFYIVLLYSFYVSTVGALGQTSMDSFIATILNVCITQLQILRVNFEVLPQSAAALSKESDEEYDAALHRLLVDCLLHYQKITEMCALLNDIFSVPLLVQLGIGAWILCMAAYEIVDLNVASVEFASTTLFIICIIIELLLFCYYGTLATFESDRVGEAIYSMEWFRTPVWFQRSLLVVMERAKRALRPTAGHIMPLSLATFVTIIKSSYSFYAVLRQTKETKN